MIKDQKSIHEEIIRLSRLELELNEEIHMIYSMPIFGPLSETVIQRKQKELEQVESQIISLKSKLTPTEENENEKSERSS